MSSNDKGYDGDGRGEVEVKGRKGNKCRLYATRCSKTHANSHAYVGDWNLFKNTSRKAAKIVSLNTTANVTPEPGQAEFIQA